MHLLLLLAKNVVHAWKANSARNASWCVPFAARKRLSMNRMPQLIHSRCTTTIVTAASVAVGVC